MASSGVYGATFGRCEFGGLVLCATLRGTSLIVHGVLERLVEDRVHVLDRALAETARGALAVQASHISGLQLGQLELADALDDVIVNITLVAGPGARSQVGLLVGDQSVKNVATLTERGGSTGWLWAKA